MKTFNLLSDLKDNAFYSANLKRQISPRLNTRPQTAVVEEVMQSLTLWSLSKLHLENLIIVLLSRGHFDRLHITQIRSKLS